MARLLIDGMNVMGARPDGWWRDRDAAVRRLVERLVAWAERSGDEVTAVFDGDRPADLPAAGGVGLRFAGRRGVADDVITRLVEDDPDPACITVITSDAALASRVRTAGAAVTGAGAFRRLIDAA